MSRIGRQPVLLPKGVETKLEGRTIRVKGPKGSLEVELAPGIDATIEDGNIVLDRPDDSAQNRSFHGLSRALLANAVTGVSEGWKKELEIVWVGHRAATKGKNFVVHLGYSNPVEYEIPDGIEIEVDDKTSRISVSGIDRQKVGQVAAEIRALRPPEPYKGKGIRYVDEYVRKKAGKQGVQE